MDTNMNTPRILVATTFGLLLLGFTAPSPAPVSKPHTPLRKAMPLAWKTHTGSASFRTNVILTDDLLIMGSNGSYFMDWNLFDSLSGIHALQRANGKPAAHFANDAIGDMDVNGTLLLEGRLYFGNDNDEFFCTTPKGRTLWNISTSGDVEHQPVTLRSGNRNLVVFATERGEVCAVEPILGKRVWSYYLDNFDGWKTGDNRAWFKVTSHFENSTSFFTKPTLADLNADGIDDLVYVTYDSRAIALDGRNGRRLWTYNGLGRLTGSLIPMGSGKDAAVLCLESHLERKTQKPLLSLTRIDGKGKRTTLFRTVAREGFGLNTLSLPSGDILVTTDDRLLVFNPYTRKRRWINRAINHYEYDSLNSRSIHYSRNSSESLIGNRTFPYRGDSSCIAVVDQYDRAFYEKGVLEIISLDKGRLLRRFSLEARSELPPFIADIDRDGRLDLLVNTQNDTTYCYRLER